MTKTIKKQQDDDVAPPQAVAGHAVDGQQLAWQLVEHARAERRRLTGPDGLLAS